MNKQRRSVNHCATEPVHFRIDHFVCAGYRIYVAALCSRLDSGGVGTEQYFAFSFFPSQSFIIRCNVRRDPRSEAFFSIELPSLVLAYSKNAILIRLTRLTCFRFRALENAVCVTY